MYIDGGKPAPGLIETTVRNLREISPTICFNAPRGYDALLPYLEADRDLPKELFCPSQGPAVRGRGAAGSHLGAARTAVYPGNRTASADDVGMGLY